MTDEPERDDDAETHEQEEKQAASPGGGTAEADETEAEPLSKPEDDEGVEFELRELEEVAAELERRESSAEVFSTPPKSVEEELEELKEVVAGDEGEDDAATPEEIADEIRSALDSEDGVPTGSALVLVDDDDVESTRIRTGFLRAHIPLMLLLPLLTYWLWICMTFYDGRMVFPTSWRRVVELASHVPAPTWQAVVILTTWIALQALLQAFVPGRIALGEPLPDGRRLRYKMNGLISFLATLGLALGLVLVGALPTTLFHDHFGPLLTVGHIFAFAFSLILYFYGKATSEGGRLTGKPLYDYFMGTARNPRIGDFDFKLFFEARPGLILWVLINLSFAAKQYELHGTVTTPMLLVCGFQLLYVVDYFVHEKAILATMDIKHENFGWMLCWGDFPWVPFVYSLQAMYLVSHTHELAWWAIAAILALNMGGYFLFRSVNSQKDRFREHPDDPIWGAAPEYIRTARGTLLLTSGYWGKARHLNYLGDLMMGLAWCLPCGFAHPLPYFYFFYFAVLLLHRQWRDDAMCQAKYGRDWDAYREQVPWRIIPYVY